MTSAVVGSSQALGRIAAGLGEDKRSEVERWLVGKVNVKRKSGLDSLKRSKGSLELLGWKTIARVHRCSFPVSDSYSGEESRALTEEIRYSESSRKSRLNALSGLGALWNSVNFKAILEQYKQKHLLGRELNHN